MRNVSVTPVELQHIDAPVGERLCVKFVVVECTRESSTRPTTDVFVYAQLQAF